MLLLAAQLHVPTGHLIPFVWSGALKTFQISFLRLLPTLALTVALFSGGQLLRAQTAPDDSRDAPTARPQRAVPPDDPDGTQEAFTGVIVKSADKLVLFDTVNKTTYQLDDQEKAQDFVRKNVKVTGVLDPSTGTIRVRDISPI